MPNIEIVVRHDVGLHARPATQFVQTAASFPCTVKVRNVTTGSDFVDAKSILGILTLAVNQDNTVEVEAEGEQAEEALEALKQLVLSNFGE